MALNQKTKHGWMTHRPSEIPREECNEEKDGPDDREDEEWQPEDSDLHLRHSTLETTLPSGRLQLHSHYTHTTLFFLHNTHQNAASLLFLAYHTYQAAVSLLSPAHYITFTQHLSHNRTTQGDKAATSLLPLSYYIYHNGHENLNPQL